MSETPRRFAAPRNCRLGRVRPISYVSLNSGRQKYYVHSQTARQSGMHTVSLMPGLGRGGGWSRTLTLNLSPLATENSTYG